MASFSNVRRRERCSAIAGQHRLLHNRPPAVSPAARSSAVCRTGVATFELATPHGNAGDPAHLSRSGAVA